MLVAISRSQDAEVGDGTTSVTTLSGEFLKESKSFIEDGISPHLVIRGLRTACDLSVKKIKEIQVEMDKKHSKIWIVSTCKKFEESQIGGDRYNLVRGCSEAETCTLILRGGSEQVIAEVERSLQDAIMIFKRPVMNTSVVAGGSTIEMEISRYLRDYSKALAGKQQLIIGAYARALEVIPRQLCENTGLDGIELLKVLRSSHAKGEMGYGVDFQKESVGNNMESFIWEPSLVKINALQFATEAAKLLLSVDETIKNQDDQADGGRGQGAF